MVLGQVASRPPLLARAAGQRAVEACLPVRAHVPYAEVATSAEQAAETSSGRSGAAGPARRENSPDQEAPQDDEWGVPVLRCTLTLCSKDACQGSFSKLALNIFEGCSACGCSGEAERDCNGCHGSGKALQAKVVSLPSYGKAIIQYKPDCRVCSGAGAMTETCQMCCGAGRVLETTSVIVEVEPGTETGKVVCLRGQGNVGVRGGQRGDLMVHIRVMASHEDPAHVDAPVGEQMLGMSPTIWWGVRRSDAGSHELRVRVTSSITRVQTTQCALAQQWPPRPVPALMSAQEGRR